METTTFPEVAGCHFKATEGRFSQHGTIKGVDRRYGYPRIHTQFVKIKPRFHERLKQWLRLERWKYASGSYIYDEPGCYVPSRGRNGKIHVDMPGYSKFTIFLPKH